MSLKGEESPSVGLSLELGPKIPSSSHSKTGFTFFQLQELEHQALIYKYLQAGIPVPPYLVIPIWKSLVHSCSRLGIHPSVLRCSGGVCFDYRNTMEAEPGRCRRTDGKKWRCSKDVVPDQKYCERHMHRGRNRSRKPVETNHGNSSNASLSFPMPLQFMTPATTSTTTPTGNNNGTNYVSHQAMDFSPQIVLQTKPEHNPVYENCS